MITILRKIFILIIMATLPAICVLADKPDDDPNLQLFGKMLKAKQAELKRLNDQVDSLTKVINHCSADSSALVSARQRLNATIAQRNEYQVLLDSIKRIPVDSVAKMRKRISQLQTDSISNLEHEIDSLRNLLTIVEDSVRTLGGMIEQQKTEIGNNRTAIIDKVNNDVNNANRFLSMSFDELKDNLNALDGDISLLASYLLPDANLPSEIDTEAINKIVERLNNLKKDFELYNNYNQVIAEPYDKVRLTCYREHLNNLLGRTTQQRKTEVEQRLKALDDYSILISGVQEFLKYISEDDLYSEEANENAFKSIFRKRLKKFGSFDEFSASLSVFPWLNDTWGSLIKDLEANTPAALEKYADFPVIK